MTNQELEYRALKILEQQPDLTQRQLAEKLGVSLGKTHYLVKSLIDVGWVKLDNFQRSDNKWGYAYLLTPMGIVEKAAITATVVFCVGFINAVNMADGANGLMSGIMTIAYGLFFFTTCEFVFASMMSVCSFFCLFKLCPGPPFLGV